MNVMSKSTVVLSRKGRRFCAVWSVLAPLILAATPATEAAAQDSSDRIEEVIVTAQKKEESLLKTPVAVGVLSGNYLEDSLVSDFTEITQRIPGFAFEQQHKSQTAVGLRGAGSLEDSPGADPAVGFFVDGVYMGSSATFDFELLDLERVEILRGPQGTTFGRNVVGGAINFVTRDPTDERTASTTLTYGRFDRFDMTGSVSGPLIDGQLSALASFSSRNSDGYTRNLATGNRLDQDDQTSGRVKLRWTPTEDFEAVVAADYSQDDSFGFSRVFIGPAPPVVGSVSTNPSEANQDFDGGFDRTLWGVSSTLTHLFKETGELVSVTSYRESSHRSAFEIDGIPISIINFADAESDIEEFSQEFRVVHSWDKLDYIAGLYYFRQERSLRETIQEAGAPGSLIDSLLSGAQLTEILGQSITVNSYAAFAQGTYNITDRLRATVGARYTWEEKFGESFCAAPALQCGEVYNVPVSQDWSAFTPKFTLDADLTEDVFAYATVSRGFKSGGFAYGFEEPESAAVPFDPEFALNYELGFKTLWLDDRLQLNVTGFHVEYDDLQVRFFDSGEQAGRTIVGNAGSAENTGLELEFQARPARALDLWVNYTFQDAVYKSLVLEGEDFSGNTPLLSPKHSVSVGGKYTHNLPNGGAVKLMADLSSKSEYFGTPANNPDTASKYDGLINASITYAFPNQHLELQFSGKNLRNERVSSTTADMSVFVLPAEDFLAGAQALNSHFTPPRTWAVTLRYSL